MRTLVEAARTMLQDAGFKKDLWAEAVNTAAFVINRTGPSKIPNKTPYELLFNKDFNIDILKRFGSEVYVHIPKQKRLKWDAKSKRGIFVGYGETCKGYRIWIPDTKDIEIHRDVTFIKGQMEEHTFRGRKEKEKDYPSKYFKSNTCVDGSLNDVEKDKRVLARICLCVKPWCLQYVRNSKTCKEAWDLLANVFEDKCFYRRAMLLRKLHRTQFENFSSISAYIEIIMTLIQQLGDIGKNTEDAEIAEILLSGLPSEYDMPVSSLESASMTKLLTSDLVKTRLLQEEMRK
ncbi:unnamed protein product [Euphydryas editha]|uniref:Retroviral polymerase SH3-like domain-containing protein n=1 Tax=Euphydryas editha TaxID=104508 RepID=A0AAU9U2K2_EUPED|nr:unnamed protein product [Euphydryas editha]